MSISEYQLLNKVLEDKNYSFFTDNMLDEEHFTQAKEEYEYIKEFYEKYHSVPDKETFTAKFPKFDYFNVSQPISSIVDALREQALFRRAVNILNHSTEIFEQDATAGAEYLLANIDALRPQIEFSCTDIMHNDKRYKEYLDRQNNFDTNYIPLPFQELNDTLYGYQRGEELFLWLARSGVGKTMILAMSIANAAKLGYKVGVISPELSKERLGLRIDSCLGGFSNTALNTGLKVDGYEAYFKDILKSDKHIFVADTTDFVKGTVTVNQCRNFVLSKQLDILFIDGIVYVKPDGDIHHKTMSECLGETGRQLFQLSKEFGIPVAGAVQARRRANEKKSNEEDTTSDAESIFGSYELTQAATRIVTINKVASAIKLIDAKNRYGIEGKEWIYSFDFNRMTMDFIPNLEELENNKETKEELEETKKSFKNIF